MDVNEAPGLQLFTATHTHLKPFKRVQYTLVNTPATRYIDGITEAGAAMFGAGYI